MVGPILGGSSDVALCADVAPLAHNHLDCRDLLRRRVIHDGPRKALATIRPEEMLTDDPLCGGSAYGPRRLLRTYAGVAARNRD